MSEEQQRQLEKAGLSPNEAKCYLALLKLGSSSANELSRASGIHRVSVYDALRGLREKGLISQILKANKLLFEAGNPERVLEIIKEKEETLETAKKIVPELLLGMGSAKQKQEIHSYKGVAGIKNILQEMLKSKTEILDFGAEFKVKEFLPYYYPAWDKERVQKKIKMRIVANIKIKPVKMPVAEIRYVPSEFHSSVSTYIFDGKVALIMWVENPMGILIEHKDVYESYKNYFEYLWEVAELYTGLSRAKSCQYLHGFEEKDIKKFINLAKMRKGMNILDAMCGSGILSKEIFKTKDIHLHLLDSSSIQIEEAKKSIKNANFVVSDILKTPFENNFFDRIFVRSGIHEAPKEKQTKLYKEIFRILKQRGQFLNWTPKLNRENQWFVQEVVRYKDRLAGYGDLVKNRYFPNQEEFEKGIIQAGFSSVKEYDLGISYIVSTEKWCKIDFKGDRNKLKELNEFVIKTISQFIPRGIKVTQKKEDIRIKIPVLISIAIK